MPIVNRLLLAVNLAAWIYVVYLTRQPGALEAFFDRYSFDWLEFTRRIASGDLGVLCGIVAAIGQGLISPGPMVGASGAIAGVLGAYLILSPTARVSTLVFLGFFITIVELPALFIIGMFIVLQILEGVAELRVGGHAAAQHVAYFAHICGFIAGLLLLVFFRRGDAERRVRFG